MEPLSWGLGQAAGSDPPTGLIVAVALAFLVAAVFAVRGLIDWVAGGDDETHTYRLVEDAEGAFSLARAEPSRGERPVGLEAQAMDRLLVRAEERNEIRIHRVLDPDGAPVDWEDWRANPERLTPATVILEDSKGLVEVDRSGRVTATPPLDEAVRGDLVEVLEGAVRDA